MRLNPKTTKALIVIAVVISLCTILSKILTSSETLADYAGKNPDIAYATSESESEISTLEEINSKYESSLSDESIYEETIPIDEFENVQNRIVLEEGFYYEPIPDYIKEKINGISYPEDALISYDELRYLIVKYHNFNDEVETGELICNSSIADDLLDIFHTLYQANYQFEQISLIDEYQGDDTLSMEHNNTSCFNYRIVDGTNKLSKHAYGLAIDINPFYNPYVTYDNGSKKISPKGSEMYADRESDFPYKIDKNDLCYKLFIEHGFSWGGDWNSCKDYQHFQKSVD